MRPTSVVLFEPLLRQPFPRLWRSLLQLWCQFVLEGAPESFDLTLGLRVTDSSLGVLHAAGPEVGTEG